jgi:hypothetical protein
MPVWLFDRDTRADTHPICSFIMIIIDAHQFEIIHHAYAGNIFFFFQVNASGQFVSLAEMVGRVDFDKTVEHWQQDKWTGCFPVKWLRSH